MLKNNKGFTMVELLATVTILGILATIAIVSVTITMKKAHDEYDQKQNKLFTTAAQTYFTDNRNALPKKLLTTSEVTLQELIDKNYIEEIVDYKKKAYDKKNSKAYVKKTGAGKYIYYSVLVGSDGREIKDNLENKKSDDINTVIGAPDLKNTDMKKSLIENNKTIYYVNKQITIPIELSSTTGISSYQYKINKLSSIKATGKKYKTSGEIAVDATSFRDTISINAKDFANGIYQLEIDAYGYQAEVSPTTASYIIVIDKTKPKCEISVDGTPGNFDKDIGAKWFKAGKLTAKMTITEQNKYQYALAGADTNLTYYDNTASSETKDFNNSIVGKKLNGYVIDKAGNKGNCETEKPIYYDNTKPTCEIKSAKEPDGNNGWYLSDISLSLKRYDDNGQNQSEQGDNESGITAYGLSNNSTSNYNSVNSVIINNEGSNIKWYGYVKDKAGNENNCSRTFKLEKTNPTCQVNFNKEQSKINNSYTGWFTEDVSATVGYETETISGIFRTHVKYGDRPTSSDPNNITLNNGTDDWVYGELVDNAGRWATCEKYARVDTVKPTCNISLNGTHGNGGWYKAGELKATITIDETNKNKYAVGFNNPTSYNNNTEGTETYTISTSEKGEKLEVNLLDQAGNPGHCETDPIYYDKELPTCVSKVTSSTPSGKEPNGTLWYGHSTSDASKGITVFPTCNDEGGSGCMTQVSLTTTGATENVTNKSYTTDREVNANGTSNLYWTVYDEAGNSGSCSATYNVDKSEPSCYWDGESTTWTQNNRTIKLQCGGDDGSGCNLNKDFVTFTFNTSTKTIEKEGTIKDYAGNSKSCKKTLNVYVDKDAPTHTKWCVCNNSAFASSGGGVYKYVQKMKLYDKMSGINESWWGWQTSNKTSGCQSTIKSDSTQFDTTGCDQTSHNDSTVYNSANTWFGYIGVSTSGGNYTYKICDVVGNCTIDNKKLNTFDPKESNCDCSSHSS